MVAALTVTPCCSAHCAQCSAKVASGVAATCASSAAAWSAPSRGGRPDRGLGASSPVAACNPRDRRPKTGSIGLPLPATEFSIRSLEDPMVEMPRGELLALLTQPAARIPTGRHPGDGTSTPRTGGARAVTIQRPAGFTLVT